MANSQTFRQVRVSPPQDFANARGGRSAEAAVRLFDYISNRIIGKLYEAQCLHYCFENDVQHASLDVGKSFVFYVADQRQQALEVFRNAINATVRFGSLSALLYNKNTKSVFAFPTVETESKEENAEFDADVYRLNVKNITALKEHAKFCAPSVSCEVLPSFVADANVVLPQSVDEDCRLSDVLREILSQPLPLWFYALKFSGWKVRERNVGDGLLLLYAKEPLSQDELIGTEFWFTRWAAILSNESFSRIRDEWAVKSAVGSIMSRNGSHNIGSHVLSALSHNVGTMPDDRVLYQYIQHRMDYIATATTDFPQWTIPTLFVGGLMKNFYAQKHLLDYISRSEGLRAYKFQERNLDDAARKNQHGTIRIFVRKFSLQQPHEKLPANQCLYHGPDGKDHSIHYFFGERATLFRELPAEGSGAHRRCVYEVSDSGGTAQFLESNEKYVPEWDQDVRVAIPGGVIGQHAFYTIIENVIRNAAKHGWASDQNLREKDLEINVDFEENKDFVLFTIGDNVSDIFGGAKDFWNSFFSEFGSVKTAQKTLKALRRLDGECPKWKDVRNWIKPPDPDKPDFNKLEEHEFQSLFLRACLKPLENKDAKQLAECFPDDKTATEGKAGLPVFHRVLKAYGIKYQKDNNVKWEKGKDLVLPLHHDQHRKLAQSFINESGELRQENWGLAEMKISAGYLAQRAIDEIGGLKEKGNDILTPIAMPGVCRNAQNCSNCISCSTGNFKDWSCYKDDENCPVRSRRFHLGYQFRINKPKEILIVANGSTLTEEGGVDLLSGITTLGENGIHIAVSDGSGENESFERYTSKTSHSPLSAFNYRYVVFLDKENGENGELNPRFCFRQIYGLRNHAAFLDAVANGKVDELRRMVFSAWLEKLKAARGFQGERIALTLNVRGTDAGSERGLVTAQDLMETMFKECYHTALIAFIADPPASIELSDTTKHLIMLLSLIKVMPETLQRVPENVDCTSGAGIKECIRGQLSAYCDLLKTRLFLSCEFIDALKSISRYSHVTEEDADRGERKILRDIEEIGRSFEAAIARRLFRAKIEESDFVKRGCEALTQFLINTEKDDLDNWLDAFRGRCDVFNRFPDGGQTRRGKASGATGFDQTIKAVLNACTIPEEAEFEALVESLNSMFLASDVYLRKYEERIATLPEAYRHDDSRPQVQSELKLQDIVDRLINVGGSESVDRVIKYSRHDRSKPENAIYAEALSGSQSYLNSLSRMMSNLQGKEVTAQVTRLLENALLRVLIIDERMANFLRDHADDRMIETFSNMGIFVADVNKEEPTLIEGLEANALYPVKHQQYKSEAENVLEFKGDFDILIIHQGIIDKWWEKHDSKTVGKILENISENCKGKNGGTLRVVVTTGRGRPDNIPPDAKVLPFSSVESALFRRYPEKVILVNTVLNLLPYKDVNGKSNT